MITDADMPAGYRLLASTASELFIVDADDPELQIRATLEDEGDLWYWLRTKRESDGSRGTVYSEVLFDLAMRHFGPRVLSIAGFWTEFDNWETFHRLRRAGKTDVEAAAGTWAGRMVGRYGFRPTKVETLRSAGKDDGVGVVFTRTGSAG